MSRYRDETDQARASVDYWAQLCYEDGTSHGAVLMSPSFDTQGGLSEWVRRNREDAVEVFAYERDLRTGKDRPLNTRAEDELPPDPDRLRDLLSGARSRIDEGRRRAAGRGVQRVDHRPTTEVLEDQVERERVARLAAETRESTQALDRSLTNAGNAQPILRYDDVYDKGPKGESIIKAAYREDVDAMRQRTRRVSERRS